MVTQFQLNRSKILTWNPSISLRVQNKNSKMSKSPSGARVAGGWEPAPTFSAPPPGNFSATFGLLSLSRRCFTGRPWAFFSYSPFDFDMDFSLIPIYLVLAVPVALLSYYIYRTYQESLTKKNNLKKGIGRGVSGFQTGVRRVAVPPEIMERIRRGEEVSGEEITRAQERLAAASKQQDTSPRNQKTSFDEDWLPGTHVKSSESEKKIKQRKR
ncbi:hypothetical protein O181_017663 [Austropuccinia psidii MF-1]|uniref:Uncharacterized protein n=1 Tax=Austropuccinia psidii MF-1 TaxID=1389203 RepID=A0A9Q3C6H8_9BASI|nr:hypothetical protein [Austropuccinia psidii MF-1]